MIRKCLKSVYIDLIHVHVPHCEIIIKYDVIYMYNVHVHCTCTLAQSVPHCDTVIYNDVIYSYNVHVHMHVCVQVQCTCTHARTCMCNLIVMFNFTFCLGERET